MLLCVCIYWEMGVGVYTVPLWGDFPIFFFISLCAWERTCRSSDSQWQTHRHTVVVVVVSRLFCCTVHRDTHSTHEGTTYNSPVGWSVGRLTLCGKMGKSCCCFCLYISYNIYTRTALHKYKRYFTGIEKKGWKKEGNFFLLQFLLKYQNDLQLVSWSLSFAYSSFFFSIETRHFKY